MVRTPPLCTVLERTGDLTPAFQFLANGRPQFFPLLEFFILNDFSRPWKMPGGKKSRFNGNLFLSSSGWRRGALGEEISVTTSRKGMRSHSEEEEGL